MKGYLELGLSGNISHLKYDDPFIMPTTVCNAFWGFISLDGIFHIFLMQQLKLPAAEYGRRSLASRFQRAFGINQ